MSTAEDLGSHTTRLGGRRLAALLVGLEAVLIVTPLLFVSHTFSSAGGIGKVLSFSKAPGVIVQDAALLLMPITAVLLLVAAMGLWRGTRGIAALLLQPLVLVAALFPMTRSGTLASAVGAWGNWLLALLAVIVILLLIRTIASPAGRRKQPRWPTRWWLPVGYVIALVAIAGVGATSRSLPYDPTSLLASKSSGEVPATSAASVTMDIPQNPSLAADPYNSMHNDTWATDVYRTPGPSDPLKGRVESLYTGGDCSTLTINSSGNIVTICSTLTAAVAYVIDPATLEVLAKEQIGVRKPSFTDFSGGGYFMLDKEDRLVFPAQGGEIRAYTTGGDDPAIKLAQTIDVNSVLADGENVQALMPDWESRYWFIGAKGTVGVVNADGSKLTSYRLEGEDIENSLAIAEDGAYIVSSAAMYKFTADGANTIQPVWRTEYDAGTRQKPGQTSRASGTTPTIFADGARVAIGDNAEPQLNVLVFNTSDGAQTCKVPVFTPDRSAGENSIIAAGNRLVIENNYGYAPAPASATGGHTTEPGLAAVDVDGSGGCSLAWQNDEASIPSVVSKGSLATNQVFSYTKPRSIAGLDAWYFTAIDLATGEQQWTRLAGTGLAPNNHYAAAYLGPNGDFYVGTIRGIVVLRNAG